MNTISYAGGGMGVTRLFLVMACERKALKGVGDMGRGNSPPSCVREAS